MKNAFVYLFIFTFMISCSDQIDIASVSSQENQSQFTVENGIVAFRDRESYENLLNNLKVLSGAALLNWENNGLQDFISLRKAFEEMTEEDVQALVNSGVNENGYSTLIDTYGEPELVRNIDLDALATITNSKGLIIIGNSLYKIYYNRVLEYNFKSIEDLQFVDFQELEKANQVNTYITDRQLKPIEYIGGRVEGDAALCIDWYYGDKRRFAAEIWVTNTEPLYSGAGARAKHQKKVLGIWGNSKTNQIRLSFDITFTGLYFGIDERIERVTYDSGVKYNEKKIEYTWDACVNVKCSFSASGWARVDGIGDDGSSQGCTASNL